MRARCRTPGRNGSCRTSHCVQVGGLRHRFDDLEPATVLERGDLRARGRDLGGIDYRQNHSRLGVTFGQNAAPRIHDEGMAEGLATVLVLAALRGRQHEGAVLDRARAVKHVPMSFAGLPCEGRWDGEERASGLAKSAVERGADQITADYESEPSPPQR